MKKTYTWKDIQYLINIALKKDTCLYQPFKQKSKSYFQDFEFKIERPKLTTWSFRKLFLTDDK